VARKIYKNTPKKMKKKKKKKKICQEFLKKLWLKIRFTTTFSQKARVVKIPQ